MYALTTTHNTHNTVGARCAVRRVNRFDLPYLFERADALGLPWFRKLTKVKGVAALYYKQTFTSAQVGTKESMHYVMPGRITMDVFELIKTNYKLRAYNLNAVSRHFLGDQKKEDMSYKDIPRYQRTSSATRAVLAKYCMQDTVLVSLLIDKLQLVVNNIEMARVVGVCMLDVWERGQSFKILRKLLQYTKRMAVFVPTYARNDDGNTYVPYYDDVVNDQMTLQTVATTRQTTLDDFGSKRKRSRPSSTGRTIGFQGATVLEPTVGLHTKPTCVLDFASLYPSIMRFWNLSYDTFLCSDADAEAKGLRPDQVYTSPNGFKFVRKEVREGILPMIETELLAARKRAKKQMAEATDPLTKSVYDGKQLALKVCCNSIYGFTGSNVGPLPMIPVSSSVTAIGRECIETSKDWMQRTFPLMHPEQQQYAQPGQLAAECVYGDTDSVFIKFNTAGEDGSNAVEQALGWAQELDKLVNDTSPRVVNGHTIRGLFDLPMYLEYEKTFAPFLLLKKKKYLSMKYEFDPHQGKISASGIEMVRRDNTLFCAQTMETFVSALLQDNDLPKALAIVRAAVGALVRGEVSYELLTQSKKLSKLHYKTKVPHITVLNKMRRRCPAEAPKLGDRVAFVILAGAPGEKSSARAEDPKYAEAHQLPLDLREYVRTQLDGPLTRILEVVIGRASCRELFDVSRYERIEGRTSGALLSDHGFTSSVATRTIQPRKQRKTTGTTDSKITSFFGAA